MTANGIVVVSAIGNDGPLYGTLNNPADMFDTIGVGGVSPSRSMAKFSSRGMTTWELPFGYGRFKPDITALGTSVVGSKVSDAKASKSADPGCRTLSGTSVASPVVAGAAALLLSDASGERWAKGRASPAAVKQVLVESAQRFPSSNVFEQGAGQLNVTLAWELLEAYSPRASLLPPALDFTDCPYMWPHCSQPLYFTGMPAVANLTIINGLGVSGRVSRTTWRAHAGSEGLLAVHGEWSEPLWPWSGFLALSFAVTSEAAALDSVVRGSFLVTVEALGADGVHRSQAALSRLALVLLLLLAPFCSFFCLLLPSSSYLREGHPSILSFIPS